MRGYTRRVPNTVDDDTQTYKPVSIVSFGRMLACPQLMRNTFGWSCSTCWLHYSVDVHSDAGANRKFEIAEQISPRSLHVLVRVLV